MQKRFLFVLPCFILFLSSYAQTTQNEPLYKRFPELPPLNLLKTDSTTSFTEKDLKNNRPVLIMIFSPDCDHCKKETEELIASKEKFEKIQVVMATPLPFEKMREFYQHYQLGNYENITVGQDTKFLLMNFYSIQTLPFMAFYDKKGNLIDAKSGNMTVDEILEKFK